MYFFFISGFLIFKAESSLPFKKIASLHHSHFLDVTELRDIPKNAFKETTFLLTHDTEIEGLRIYIFVHSVWREIWYDALAVDQWDWATGEVGWNARSKWKMDIIEYLK